MVIPAITDVTMTALCPGKDECSLAIYLSGIQQAMIGFGTLVMMPVIGNMSDQYGRKALLTLPLTLSIVPLGLSLPWFVKAVLIALLLLMCTTFSQAAVVAFFNSLAEGGMQASTLYFLKARFHFNKDQFADLMLISGFAATVSQLLFMPLLTPMIGEKKLLSIGLFVGCTNMFLYSISWSAWVPYALSLSSVFVFFAIPALRSIASKLVGSNEQGKVQGCISGISSFANILSPLIFSPLTALFLSDKAPFNFPGFSILGIGLAMMITFIQSLLIRDDSSTSRSQNQYSMVA
ncbi:hypothetical protein EZV62_011932 [Acer yangbiense]|uniref:Major facilitator superfamily (MFS) profile domain-containing protein n=1 Tax=Acer yangbiense TaxID=1000413 RepID=A0A5C7I7B6_9ROSI|nr:hypothetical protein EZV62_011932 [Acer yangbiense]